MPPVSPSVIDDYFRSVNTEDWTLMAGLWNADGRLQAVGFPLIAGRDDVVAYYPRVLAGYPEHVDTPTRVITAGDTVVVEIDFTGRLADGREIAFSAVDVFDLAGGRIQRLSTWYDSHRVITQLRSGAPAAG